MLTLLLSSQIHEYKVTFASHRDSAIFKFVVVQHTWGAGRRAAQWGK